MFPGILRHGCSKYASASTPKSKEGVEATTFCLSYKSNLEKGSNANTSHPIANGNGFFQQNFTILQKHGAGDYESCSLCYDCVWRPQQENELPSVFIS
jgi:hypothetical protein